LYFAVDPNPVGGTKQWATLWNLKTSVVATGQTPPAGAWSPFITMNRPTAAILDQQLELVNGYADLRIDRAREIVAQMSPQYAFWGSVVPLYGARHRHTIELIGMVLRLAKYAEMNFKNALCVRRPHEYSAQIQPMIQTPIHGSLPSGHSTEAHAVARVLCRLISGPTNTGSAQQLQLRQQLMAQAARIAINRTVAGVHYPVDSQAGQMLGIALGDYFIARATGSAAPVDAWKFDGELYPGLNDFTGLEIYDLQTNALKQPLPAYMTPNNTITVDTAPGLNWLWTQASLEW
jgi:membrane-associated phospholipid phosphatase